MPEDNSSLSPSIPPDATIFGRWVVDGVPGEPDENEHPQPVRWGYNSDIYPISPAELEDEDPEYTSTAPPTATEINLDDEVLPRLDSSPLQRAIDQLRYTGYSRPVFMDEAREEIPQPAQPLPSRAQDRTLRERLGLDDQRENEQRSVLSNEAVRGMLMDYGIVSCLLPNGIRSPRIHIDDVGDPLTAHMLRQLRDATSRIYQQLYPEEHPPVDIRNAF